MWVWPNRCKSGHNLLTCDSKISLPMTVDSNGSNKNRFSGHSSCLGKKWEYDITVVDKDSVGKQNNKMDWKHKYSKTVSYILQ